ncbi:swi5-dependent recombination DNA repair protein 1 homolog isoform X1 [Lepisosteus oculatus]|uniref:swi5-dependent recombination DNA repair protein 1 homolog isoform X1 n=1 Tax=Lepisosteus oculatus TaxID=7918 RepID=UPI00371B5E2F
METPNTRKTKPVFCTPDSTLNSTPHGLSVKQPMSASLKERLKRTRRSFHSPFTVAKRLKIDPPEAEDDSKVQEVSPKSERDLDSAGGNTLSINKGRPWESPEVTDTSRQWDVCRTGTESGNEAAQSSSSRERADPPAQIDLLQLRDRLKKEVGEKEEMLRRLKMVRMYRTKNDLDKLQFLINKWRGSSQAVLYELKSAFCTDGRQLSLTQLIDHYGLDDRILHYNRTEEEFSDQ